MGLDVAHEELDGPDGNQEGHHHAHQEDGQLAAGEAAEFDQLDQAAAEHGGDGQEEGEFRRRGPGDADDQGRKDGGAGAGGAGKHRCDELEEPDEQRRPVGDAGDPVDHGLLIRTVVFHHDEQHPEEDEHDRHGPVVVKQGGEGVVERDADDGGGQGGHDDLPPHGHLIVVGFESPFEMEGEQLVPEQDHHGQDGTQLDDHQVHVHEGWTDIQLDEFVEQDHVSGAADGQPLGDPLHNAEEDGFDNIEHGALPFTLSGFEIIIAQIGGRLVSVLRILGYKNVSMTGQDFPADPGKPAVAKVG